MINTSNIKIGESFRYKNYILVCAPEPLLSMTDRDFECCRECFFVTEESCSYVKCAMVERKDGNNVIFKIDQRKTDRINDGVVLCDKLIKKYKDKKSLEMLSKIKNQLIQYNEAIAIKNQMLIKLKSKR